MSKILIITIAHPAKDTRLFYKIGKTLAKKNKITILHNNTDTFDDDEITLKGANCLKKAQFIAYALGQILEQNPDIVILVEPILISISAITFLKFSNLGKSHLFKLPKFIYDCHEFYDLAQEEKKYFAKIKNTIIPKEIFHTNINKLLFNCLEQSFARNLHGVITVNEIITEHFKNYNVPTITIPNYPIMNDFIPEKQECINYHFIYCGGISPDRGISEIIKATKILVKDYPQVKILLFGREQTTGYMKFCQDMIKEYELEDNIILQGPIDYSKIKELYSQALCGLCMMAPSYTRRKYTLSVKILEYLESGLMVIANDFPFNRRIYRELEGVFTAKYVATMIARKMKLVMETSKEKRALYAQQAQKLVTEKYCWKVLEKPLDNFINKFSPEKKDGLYISYFYPPLGASGVQRPLKFTKYAKDMNWKFDILTIKNILFHSYDQTLLKEAKGLEIYRTESFDPMSILDKLKRLCKQEQATNAKFDKLYFQTSSFKKKLIRQLFPVDEKIGWYLPALLRGINLCAKEDYQVIIVSVLPFSSSLIALSLSIIFNIPFYIDYRDFFSLGAYADFSCKFSRNIYSSLEVDILNKCSGIMTSSNMMRDKLHNELAIPLNKICTMFNGYDEFDFPKIISGNDKQNHKIKISYIGNMYKSQTSKFFLQALKNLIEKKLVDKNELEISFMGNYFLEEQQVFENSNLRDIIKIIPQQVHSKAIEHILNSDILLLIVGKASGIHVLPGKIFEYIRANKPILGLVPKYGEAWSILEKLDNPWLAPNENVEEIEIQLLNIINDVKKRVTVNFEYQDYSREHQVKLALSFIDETLNKKN